MIKLEKFEKSDYDRFINWIDSEAFMVQFCGPIFTYPVTYEQLDRYIDADNRLIFKVIDCETDEPIGHAELNNIDKKNSNARISRILIADKDNRNKGFGKAIIKELIRIGFADLELHRLDLGVYDFNNQAIKCYQECGFEIEGLFKDISKVGHEYWSNYNMSIINPNK
jgi:RimJ/RimL family protein N-acetyltransferase